MAAQFPLDVELCPFPASAHVSLFLLVYRVSLVCVCMCVALCTYIQMYMYCFQTVLDYMHVSSLARTESRLLSQTVFPGLNSPRLSTASSTPTVGVA